MGSERINSEIRAFLEQERKQEQAIADKKAADEAIEKAKQDIIENHRKTAALQKQLNHGIKVKPFITPGLRYIEDETERNKFNNAECVAFYKENPEWHPYATNPENRAMLIDYFVDRGDGLLLDLYDRHMLKAAFELLRRDGLLIEPVVKFTSVNVPTETLPATIEEDLEALPRLPLDFRMPMSHKRDTSGQEGIDPFTGERKHYSDFEIGRMSAETYRRTFMPIRDLNAFAGRR